MEPSKQAWWSGTAEKQCKVRFGMSVKGLEANNERFGLKVIGFGSHWELERSNMTKRVF